MCKTECPISLADAGKKFKHLVHGGYDTALRYDVFCFVYICWSNSWSDLVWYFDLRPKFSGTVRFAHELSLKSKLFVS